MKNKGCKYCKHYKYGVIKGIYWVNYYHDFGCDYHEWADNKYHPITGEQILSDGCEYFNDELECRGFKEKPKNKNIFARILEIIYDRKL